MSKFEKDKIRTIDFKEITTLTLENLKDIDEEKKNGIKKLNRGGGFFHYLNTTNLDLKKYQIFTQLDLDVDYDNICNNIDTCLIHTLKELNIEANLLNKLASIFNPSVKRKELRYIANIINSNITIHQIDNSGKLRKQTFKATLPTPTEENVDIALYEDHYFTFEKTKYSSFFIKNYEELKNIPFNPEDIISYIDKNNKKYYTRNNTNKISSLILVDTLFKKGYFRKFDMSHFSEYQINKYEKRKYQHEISLSDNKQIYKIVENDISDINDTTILTGKCFNTIADLKKCSDHKKVILRITNLKSGPIKDYLSNWLYNSYYSKKSMTGNLTDRIKNINNGVCYNEIMKRCFDSYDIKMNKNSNIILNSKTVSIIRKFNEICPPMCGIFIDYLIRRIISELISIPFSDSRANKILSDFNIITDIKADNIWEFIDNDYFDEWNIYKEPVLLISNVIGKIKKGGVFKSFEKNKEWMKIDYDGIIGWVRWKLPEDGNDTDDINLMIDNKYLKRKYHTCSIGCKYKITDHINTCYLWTCQNISYEKVKNIEKYKTKDILNDILNVSLCHIQTFGYCPKKENFDTFHDTLKTIDIEYLVEKLIEMCKILIYNKTNIQLNPSLGGQLIELENSSIPSDADLVIDDIIYDIKCTKNKKEYYEVLQLLGYSGLLLLNKNFGHKINNMIVLNILQGTSTTYCISYLEKDNFIKYIQLLNNK